MTDADAIQRLAREFASRGLALRTDRITRGLYATDASPYEVLPAGVFVPERVEDVHAAIDACRAASVSMVARGAGTSLSGQCVGAGVQVDFTRLDRIEWIDPERRLARVGPGVTWWRLDAASRAHGLEFGPDPATRRQCTIGGMIGSNSGGTHSIVAGATVDHVRAIEAVLADGAAVRFEGDGPTLAAAGAPPALARALEDARVGLAEMLGDRFAGLARRGSGYQLEHLARGDLAKLMAGSDGTLGLVTAAEVTLDVRPAARVLVVVGFDDMHAALAAVPGLVETGPSAVELVSSSLLDVARRDRVHAAAVAGVDPALGALLLVEYQGNSAAEAVSGFARMDRALDAAGGARTRDRVTDPLECARRWAVREAGVGALSAVASGPRLPQAFVEDTIVAVDRLPGYIAELERLFERHEMRTVWYGHASTGLVHVRPFLDLTQARDLARIESLMRDAVDLVRAWGGDLCGEHGDGLARSYWNERLFGPDLYARMRAVKHAFDPGNLLNPGKVVDGPHPLGSLRYGTQYRRRALAPSMGFADQGGIAPAIERCFGAGVCRKRDVGTMCPPAAATGREEHSTRARANLLRAVLSGTLEVADLSRDDAREVMETCVACKACTSECPARVDMARLKVEWADGVRHREGATPLQRAVANLRALSAAGSRLAPLVNSIGMPAPVRRILGIDPAVPMPEFVARPLTARLPAGGDVLLYPDCFTTYQEPAVGEAVARLGAAAGVVVGLAPTGCCGRAALSAGYVEKARAAAARAAAALRRTHGTIVFCEPSCLSAVVDDWPHLIGDVSDIASRARPAEDWVAGLGESLAFRGGGRALLHGHCHQKALWGTSGTERALARVPGLEVEVLDAGCCGMAGAFGYQVARRELSIAMAERALMPAVRAADVETHILASGTSCRAQVSGLSSRRAVHPLVFLAERLI